MRGKLIYVKAATSLAPLSLDCIMISYTGAGSAPHTPQHQIEEQSSTIMRLSMGSVMAYARSRFLPEFKGNIKDRW